MAVTTISSREFNQDTGKAKRAAQSGPVVITDRGRPSHVLLTIAEYEQISHPATSAADALALPKGVDVCEEFDSLIPRSRERPRVPDLS
jgi:prevent-host-death family protein